MRKKSGYPELSELELRILEIVREHWPSSALEIAENLGEDVSSHEKRKQQSTKYIYYLKKLVEKRLILSKRAGNLLLVWPIEAEAYRAIHRIISEAEKNIVTGVEKQEGYKNA
jgi:predicted transcriptional regulator